MVDMSRTQTALVLLGLRTSDGTRPKLGFMQTAAMASAFILVALILRFSLGTPSWVAYTCGAVAVTVVAFWFGRARSESDR